LRSPGRGAAPWLLLIGLLAVLALGMTGAITALGDTLFPSASLAEGLRADTTPTAHLLVRLRVLHPLLALLSAVYLGSMGWLLARLRPASIQSSWGRLLGGLVLIQLGVGLANLLLLAPTFLQILHLLIADLLWITLVVFSATALTAPPSPRPIESSRA
jgi:heme A synthase